MEREQSEGVWGDHRICARLLKLHVNEDRVEQHPSPPTPPLHPKEEEKEAEEEEEEEAEEEEEEEEEEEMLKKKKKSKKPTDVLAKPRHPTQHQTHVITHQCEQSPGKR